MKKSYIVAIDYRATYKPMTTDYKVLEALTTCWTQ